MKVCGNCAHANHEAGFRDERFDEIVFCTNPLSWNAHRSMPADYSCPRWVLEDQEPPAAYLEAEAREPGGESDSERETRVLTERGGRVGGTW